MTDLKTLKEITRPFSATDFGLQEGAIILNPAAIQEAVDLYNRAGLKTTQISDLIGMASGEVVRIFLREEAKKWIKNQMEQWQLVLDNLPMDGTLMVDPMANHRIQYQIKTYVDDERKRNGLTLISWIMYFFNITQEDLKEEKK